MCSLLIAAKNKARRINFIKAKIDKMQENSKCISCVDRNKTISFIISECSKLAQEEKKSRYDMARKVINRELRKKLKFDHFTK